MILKSATMKRSLSIMLSIVMCLSFLPTSAFATPPGNEASATSEAPDTSAIMVEEEGAQEEGAALEGPVAEAPVLTVTGNDASRAALDFIAAVDALDHDAIIQAATDYQVAAHLYQQALDRSEEDAETLAGLRINAENAETAVGERYAAMSAAAELFAALPETEQGEEDVVGAYGTLEQLFSDFDAAMNYDASALAVHPTAFSAGSYSDSTAIMNAFKNQNTSCINSSLVNNGEVYPSDYTYRVKWNGSGTTTVNAVGGTRMTQAQAIAESSTTYAAWTDEQMHYFALDNNLVGTTITYTNMGYYQGQSVDIQITILGIVGTGFSATKTGYVAFSKAPLGYLFFQHTCGDRHEVVDQLKIQMSFVKSGTSEPCNVKGVMTWWDVDGYQNADPMPYAVAEGHIFGTGTDALYCTDGSTSHPACTLSAASIAGDTYVYNRTGVVNNDNNNTGAAITECFSGPTLIHTYVTHGRLGTNISSDAVGRNAVDLTVRKTVSGTPADPTQAFTQSVKLTYADTGNAYAEDLTWTLYRADGVRLSGGTTRPDGSGMLSYGLTAGQYVVLSGLTNAAYEVNETPVPDGYNVSYKTDYYADSGAAASDTTHAGTLDRSKTVTVTNTYNRGSLEIAKAFAGDVGAQDAAKGTLSFAVTGPNNYSKTFTYAEMTNGVYTISGLAPGDYVVTETESSAQVAGYKVDIAYSIANKTVNVVANATGAITVTNTYTKTPDPVKEYAEGSTGAGGNSVGVDDEITYQLTYSNQTTTTQNVVLRDTLSKGLTYVGGSATVAPDAGFPVVNADGTTSLQWTVTAVAAGDSGTVTYVAKVNEDALVKNIVDNSYTCQVGNNPASTPVTLVNPLPEKEYAGEVGKDETQVHVGDKIDYRITYGNGSGSAANVVVTDVLSEGLSYVAGSSTIGGQGLEPSVSPDGKTLIWSIDNVASGTTGELVYSANVTEDAKAIQTVENGAAIQIGNLPKYNLTPLENPVSQKTYNSDDWENNKPAQVGDVIPYKVTFANVHDESITIRVVDAMSKGLDYQNDVKAVDMDGNDLGLANSISQAVTQTDGTTVIVWTISNVPAGTAGALVYSGAVNDDAISRQIVDNTATIDYGNGAEVLDTVRNPVPHKTYGAVTPGTTGSDNYPVKVDDLIPYVITYANGLDSATDIVITDTLSKGLTYVPDSFKVNGAPVTPSVTENADGSTSLAWTVSGVASGAVGQVTYTAQVNSDAASVVENGVEIKFDEQHDIDLTPVKNPVPEKDWAENGAGDGGAAVQVGDVIPYEVSFANVKASAVKVVIRDVMTKGLAYVANSAQLEDGTAPDAEAIVTNDDGSTTIIWTFEAIAADSSNVLKYSAEVTEDAVQKVANRAFISYDNGYFVELAELPNPVPSKKYDGDSIENNQPVEVGQTIPYLIRYGNETGGPATLTISDTLTKGLSYNDDASIEPKSVTLNPDGSTLLVWELADVASGVESQLTYSAKVDANAGSVVANGASVQYGNDPAINLNPLTNPVPHKEYQEDGYGEGSVSVEVGKSIAYQVTFTNSSADPAKVVVTDTMSIGLAYEEDTARLDGNIAPDEEDVTHNSDGTTTIVWAFDAAENGNHVLTYFGEVTQEAVSMVKNTATISYDNYPAVSLEELPNPVPQKTYDDGTEDNQPLSNGQEVTYKITYANMTGEDQDYVITDTTKVSSGKGTFTYVKGSAKLADSTALEPSSITDNADGGQTLVWKLGTLPTGTEGSITYTTKVTGHGIYANDPFLTEGDSTIDIAPLTNTIPEKAYADNTQVGDVKTVGTEIPYSIKFTNTYDSAIKVTINDTMSSGLAYASGSAKLDGKAIAQEVVTANSDGSTTITWTLPDVSTGNHVVTYVGKVTEAAVTIGEVSNSATMSYNDGPAASLDTLKNTVPRKAIAPKTGDTVNPVMPLALGGISLAALVTLAFVARKRRILHK